MEVSVVVHDLVGGLVGTLVGLEGRAARLNLEEFPLQISGGVVLELGGGRQNKAFDVLCVCGGPDSSCVAQVGGGFQVEGGLVGTWMGCAEMPAPDQRSGGA